MWELWMVMTAFIIVAAAGFIQGLVGFGSGLIMIPTLVLIIEPSVLVPVSLLQGLIMNWALTLESRKSLQLKRVVPILLGGIIGIPFGTALLLLLAPEHLKIMIGTVVVLFGILLLLGLTMRMKREKTASFPIGIASGILNGSISLSGPPVILFFSNQGVLKDNFRSNLVAYFFFLNVITTAVFLFTGLITWKVIMLTAILLPAALIGVFIGSRASKLVPQKVFRRIALLIVIGAGMLSLVTGLVGVT
ncbi:MAG: sulfite exporter TauE/SafE family protein [Thermoplasmatota archaeon]